MLDRMDGDSGAQSAARQSLRFDGPLDEFIRTVEGLRTTVPLVMEVLNHVTKEQQKKLGRYIGFSDNESGKGQPEAPQFTVKDLSDLKATTESVESFISNHKIVPQSFINTLIGQFDVFLSKFFVIAVRMKPELFETMGEKISAGELRKFDSIEDATNAILEREVESCLRGSHSDHLEWFGKKTNLDFKKELPYRAEFIEVTERRNLYTHTGGIVSKQYIDVCRSNGVDLPQNIKGGSELSMNPDYWREACRTMYMTAAVLTHLTWRKLFPRDLKSADKALNESGLSLLRSRQWKLSQMLFDFSFSKVEKFSSERMKMLMYINRIQAYKWGKKDETVKKLIGDTDWSAYGDDIQMAVHLLKDEYEIAGGILKRLAAAGKIDFHDVMDWPIFRGMRSEPSFNGLFREMFGFDVEAKVILDATGSATRVVSQELQEVGNERPDLSAVVDVVIRADDQRDEPERPGGPTKKRMLRKRKQELN